MHKTLPFYSLSFYQIRRKIYHLQCWYLHNDSNDYLDFLIQLYLFRNCRGNRKIGYGRVVAERPTGSRAGCRSAFGGSRTLGPVRPAVRPNQRGITRKLPQKSHRRSCWSMPRLIASRYISVKSNIVHIGLVWGDHLTPLLYLLQSQLRPIHVLPWVLSQLVMLSVTSHRLSL